MTASVHKLATDAQHVEKRFKFAVERSDGSLKEAVIEAEILATKFGYTHAQIGALVGRDRSWVSRIRKWGQSGFVGTPFDNTNHPYSHRNQQNKPGAGRHQDSLKSQDNFEDDTFEPDENERRQLSE